MLFVVFIWIFVGNTEILAEDRVEFCPDGVRNSKYHVATRNHTCYMFVNVEKFWDEARSHCWSMGGEMLTVDSIATMQFIQRRLNSPKLGWDREGVWSGASDLRTRGWEWTTGEKLRFTFWASGEPSKFLGLISLENCALMRREDNWRWHDYHCHMSPYEYNYICQFPFVHHHQPGKEIAQDGHGAPLMITDDKAAMIGLVIGGVALIGLMCTIIVYLHKKHKRQKAVLKQSRTSVRFQNTGYATIIQQSREGSDAQLISPHPGGNMYLEPTEVTRIYEEVAKDNVNHGVNSLPGTDEAPRMFYQGGAASVENMEDNGGYLSPTMSSISGATSGYCSTNNIESQPTTGDYLEMTAPSVPRNGKNNVSLTTTPNGIEHMKNDLSLTSGASGDSRDIKNSATCQNGQPKCSNLYVTALGTGTGAAKVVNKSPHNAEMADKSEMHIYTNQMENLDNYSLRPLPPVPTEEKTPLASVSA